MTGLTSPFRMDDATSIDETSFWLREPDTSVADEGIQDIQYRQSNPKTVTRTTVQIRWIILIAHYSGRYKKEH